MKKVFVSGGLGGLGRSISKKFAEMGWSVYYTHRSKHKEAELFLKELERMSNTKGYATVLHRAISLDLLGNIDGNDLRKKIGDDTAHLDCLINCAGISKFVPHNRLDLLDDECIDTILSTNVKAPVILIRELLPLLRTGTDPSIINITSIAARIANGSNIIYCASKSALDNITRSLARALAPDIRVFSVAPGLMDTEFISTVSKEWYEQQVEHTPLKRLASPQVVADAVYFACEYMKDSTGTCLEIDGGRALI